MKTIVRMAVAAVFMVGVALGGTVVAQAPWSQTTACPGWNNPTNFNTSSSSFYYRGRMGDKKLEPFNVLTDSTGMSWAGTILSPSQMSTQAVSGCYNTASGNGTVPSPNNEFVIMSTTSQSSGHPVNRDPNTADHLPFVPTHFNTQDTTPGVVNTNLTHSIRIGDNCAENGNTEGAAALYYNMFVNTDNALMFIYYACVIQAPGHGVNYDPAFVIRVMQQNASGQWERISDTLAYMIGSTPAQGQGITVSSSYGGYGTMVLEPNYNSNGWHANNTANGATGNTSSVFYKDWVKVALNLSNLLYQNIRIEIMIADCYGNAHWGYAYVAGECRQMRLLATGCPPGMSTDVTTIQAPRGMLNYEWSASQWGVAEPVLSLEAGGDNDYFTFRQCASGTEAAGYSTYHVQASDFRINYRPNAAHIQIPVLDSIGNQQTFRCRMTSALDPSKPFESDLYVNVTNTKPSMVIDTLKFCDGTVRLWNNSYVPGASSEMVIDSLTTWTIYPNPGCMGTPLCVLTGDSADYQFPDRGPYGVITRTIGATAGCYSEARYTVTPNVSPKPGMTVSKHVLCDADETTISDTTSGVVYREWYLLSEDATTSDSTAPRDTIRGRYGENQSFTRPFEHSLEPIELMVRNGLYYINPYNTSDTIWCQASAFDTVAVFVHPELEVTGDTIVCQGSKTDAQVRAIGVDGCTYEWSRAFGSITGGIPAGDRLQVSPYADTSVYYVRVTSPEGCVAWDSIHAYLVRPQLVMIPEDGLICPGDTVILMGLAADHYSWTASPSDPSLAGQQEANQIEVTPMKTTVYTMTGHGTNNCNASPLTKTVTVRPLPVPAINTTPGFVDVDDPTVLIRDVSTYGITTEWHFDDGTVNTGREVTHTFNNAIGQDSVYVELTSGNVLNCTVSKVFAIPVSLYTMWVPTVFTPGSEDENAIFRLYTINEYENFHIYIYNRMGALVFESDKPDFEWDGSYNGSPCQQGAYVYVCNYRKPGANTLMSKSGTITLIR